MNDLSVFLAKLTSEPGIYRMLDANGIVLYVGKASNLKKRVSSYFNKQTQSAKTRALVSQIKSVDIQITRSETEALLLESNLIKSLRPKYNILMRDDKTYPYLALSNHPDFPRLSIIRSKKKPERGIYFGPYPSVSAVRETLGIIQKVFKIRNCTDGYFNARLRPCLQYQIKRCSAPCTAYITKEMYQYFVSQAIAFLEGKSSQILDDLAHSMENAVARQAYEEAAIYRDQIKSLRLVQEQQGIFRLAGDADVIVIEARPGFACVQCVMIRNGQILESQSFFPIIPKVGLPDEEHSLWQSVWLTFINFYYLDHPERIPELIITNQAVDELKSLQILLSSSRGKSCQIQIRPRGVKARWVDFAQQNLQLAVTEHITSTEILKKRYTELEQWLSLKQPIQSMICFDISHTQGQSTVASCVAFDRNGPNKRDYRHYNITGIIPGDDYAAMEQVITRYFKRAMETKKIPDVLVIDGGKGQVTAAQHVLDGLNIHTIILGVAKGPARKAGHERLILATRGQEQTLPSDSLALHLLQHIRDESHRFAITAHRKKRQKVSISSTLEDIEGIGAKRRQALLRRFGGLRELAKASIEEIAKVQGISHDLAQRIYQHFHN